MSTLLFGFGSAVGRATLQVAPPSMLRLLYIGTPCSNASCVRQFVDTSTRTSHSGLPAHLFADKATAGQKQQTPGLMA